MNLVDVMNAYLALLREGEAVREGDPELAIKQATGYARADIVPSGIHAIDGVILAARNYWCRNLQFGRYWVVTVTGSDHGLTGLALEASDDTTRPMRKMHTGPHTPGFGVVQPADVLRAAAGEKVAPRMNTAPFLANEAAPGIDWDAVGLVIVKHGGDEMLTALFKLKEKHGFIVAYDATGEPGAFPLLPRADMVAWGVGIGANLSTVSVLLANEELATAVTELPPADNFARYTAGFVASFGSIRLESKC